AEGVPGFVAGLAAARELVNPLAHVLAKGVVGHRQAVDADDGKVLGQPLIEVEVEQGRDQLAGGKVATAAEEDGDGGLRANREGHDAALTVGVGECAGSGRRRACSSRLPRSAGAWPVNSPPPLESRL